MGPFGDSAAERVYATLADAAERALLNDEFDSLLAKMASSGGETGRALLHELAALSPAKGMRGRAGALDAIRTVESPESCGVEVCWVCVVS